MIVEPVRSTSKVTVISGPGVSQATYVRKLHAIASNLEQRADALRRHAFHLREEANLWQADASGITPDRGGAHRNRGRAKILEMYATRPGR